MKRLVIFMVLILVLLQGGTDMIVRTKKITDAAYSPAPSVSGAAIREQVDGSIQEVADLIELDIANNKKLSPTGDFTGTLNGLEITATDPFNANAFNTHLSESVINKVGKVSLVVAANDATDSEKYNADYICTGVNDQTIIQSALNSLPLTGGTVQLTSGTFNISRYLTTDVGIYVDKDNVTVKGVGISTILKRDNDANPFTVIAFGANALGLRQFGVNFGTILDLQVDGSGAATHVNNKGVFFMGGYTEGYAGSDIMDRSTVINVTAHDCGYEGISLDYQSRTVLKNNYCYNNKEAGIALYGATESIIEGNICINNNPRALNITGVSTSRIVNNYLDDGTLPSTNMRYAIEPRPLVTGPNSYPGINNIIEGNTIIAYNGIHICTTVDGSGNSNTIKGNNIKMLGSTYGISVESDHNIVSDNVISGSGTAIYMNTASNNVVNGNTVVGSGITVTNASNYNVISNNEVQGSPVRAIGITTNSNFNNVSGNFLKSGTDMGIYSNCANTKALGNIIEGFVTNYSIQVLGVKSDVLNNTIANGQGISVKANNVNIVGNYCDSVLTTASIDAYNVSYLNISGNYVQGGASHGISVNLILNSNITGNYIYGAAVGIRVVSGSNNNQIVGNFVQGCSSVGIQLNTGSTTNVVKNNNLISNVGNLTDTGTSNLVGNNAGYVTEKSGVASIVDGGTITHGLAASPTSVSLIGSTTGDIITVISVSSTTITVAIKKRADGAAETIAQNVYWRAVVGAGN